LDLPDRADLGSQLGRLPLSDLRGLVGLAVLPDPVPLVRLGYRLSHLFLVSHHCLMSRENRVYHLRLPIPQGLGDLSVLLRLLVLLDRDHPYHLLRLADQASRLRLVLHHCLVCPVVRLCRASRLRLPDLSDLVDPANLPDLSDLVDLANLPDRSDRSDRSGLKVWCS